MNGYLILSDLHLGCGDEREDFLAWGPKPAGPENRGEAMRALAARLAGFLSRELASIRRLGAAPHLVIAGDFADLWQVRARGERVSNAITRTLAAHPGVVAALRAWLGEGGKLTILLGNHDHALCEPSAWRVLSEVLPRLNESSGGAPAWSLKDDQAGLWVVHGHRWDAWNRIRRRTPNDACIGRMINRLLVNNLEGRLPLIDKLDLPDMLLELRDAWSAGLPEIAPQDAIGAFLRIERRGMRFGDCLAGALSASGMDRTSLLARQGTAFREAVRRDLSRLLRTRSPELPHVLRIVAFGHTHECARVDHEGVTFLNTGTWRPLARRVSPGRHSVNQPLHFARVLPGSASWEAAVGSLD